MFIPILTIPKTYPNIRKVFPPRITKHIKDKFFKSYNCVLWNTSNQTLKMIFLLFGGSLFCENLLSFTPTYIKSGKRFETSLAAQWLRLCTSTARGTGSIPGRGIKIPHAAWCGHKIIIIILKSGKRFKFWDKRPLGQQKYYKLYLA